MRRTTLCHIFIIVVVVAAGCNAVGNIDDPLQADHSPTTTLTPAPVPTDELIATPIPGLAPGLTQYAMDAQVLAHAHNTTLQNTSFTKKVRITATYPNGTLFSQQVTTVRVGDNGNISYVINRTNARATSETPQATAVPRYYEGWSEKTHGVIATTHTNNTTTYSEITPLVGDNGAVPAYVTGVYSIRRLFTDTETRVVNTSSRNGELLYHVTAPVLRMPSSAADFFLQRDAWQPEYSKQSTQHAFINATGVIREHQLKFRATNENKSLTVRVNRKFLKIGTTSPSRPSWFHKAINKSANQSSVRSPVPTDQP